MPGKSWSKLGRRATAAMDLGMSASYSLFDHTGYSEMWEMDRIADCETPASVSACSGCGIVPVWVIVKVEHWLYKHIHDAKAGLL
jgi:hypothetical protein